MSLLHNVLLPPIIRGGSQLDSGWLGERTDEKGMAEARVLLLIGNNMNSNQIFEYITKLTSFQLHTRNTTVDICSNVLYVDSRQSTIIYILYFCHATNQLLSTMFFLGPKDEYFDQISPLKLYMIYNVSQKLSIDESMILFKGKHSIKHYSTSQRSQ